MNLESGALDHSAILTTASAVGAGIEESAKIDPDQDRTGDLLRVKQM